MSNLNPQYQSPSFTPPPHLNGTASTLTSAAKAPNVSKPKPINIFSNDGSFLERFQRSKKEEEEKKKQEDILNKKRAFDDRFKNRGKRVAPPPPEEDPTLPPTKRSKSMTQYEKEVKSYEGRSLKDSGMGIRPLVK